MPDRHAATVLGGSTMTYVQFGVRPAYAPVITSSNVEETKDSSEPIAPLPLPPPPQPPSLNGLRGKPVSTGDSPIALKEVTTNEPGITLDLGIQPHDPAHARLYNAIVAYLMGQCDAIFYGDSDRRMRIVAREGSSGEDVGKAAKAMDEVRTLVCFIQSIGGGLEQICALLGDRSQTQTIRDLHSVLAAEPAIHPDAVLRLAKAFEVSGRPDLQLALLDHALPQCPAGPGKSKLADQWIGLATRAMDEGEGPPRWLQQVVVGGLCNDRSLKLDQEARSALEMLARRSVMRRSESED